MIYYPERALTIGTTALYLTDVLVEVQSLFERHNMTTPAHVSAIEADIECDVATETALVVDELAPMALYVAFSLADADL